MVLVVSVVLQVYNIDTDILSIFSTLPLDHSDSSHNFISEVVYIKLLPLD